MPVATTLKELEPEDAIALVDAGAAFVDLRAFEHYLEDHIPGSLSLLYESGPGMAARARDCLPLDLRLVLLDPGTGVVVEAAAALRGKGFDVPGVLRAGLDAWKGAGRALTSTAVVTGSAPDAVILDVGDPLAKAPEDALRIPVDGLVDRAGEIPGGRTVAIVAGYGVRASLAVGILERAGFSDLVVWANHDRAE